MDEHCCRVTKLNVQFHEESAIFSVSSITSGKWGGGGQGAIVATGGGDGAVRVWDLRWDEGRKEERTAQFTYGNILSGNARIKHLVTLKKHPRSVNCVRFSRDGALLATGGDEGLVMVWDTDVIISSSSSNTSMPDMIDAEAEAEADEEVVYDGGALMLRECDGVDVYDLAWGDGGLFVGLSNGTVESYSIARNLGDGQEKQPCTGGAEGGPRVKMRMVSQLKDSQWKSELVSSVKAHKDIVQGMAYNEKSTLASLGRDRVLVIYTVDKQKITKKTAHPAGRLRFSDRHSLFFRRIQFSRCGDFLYASSGMHNEECSVLVFKAPFEEVHAALGPFPSSPGAVLVEREIVCVSEGRNLYVFKASKDSQSFLFRIKDCAFLPITDFSPMPARAGGLDFLVSATDGFLSLITVQNSFRLGGT